MSALSSDSSHETSSDEDVELQTQSGHPSKLSQSTKSLHTLPSSVASARKAKQPTLQEGPMGTNLVVPTLMDNPYAEEPTYFSRPNRYFGPDSTWQSWTAEERNVAQALANVRHEDLSLHLFNAYWLKRQHEGRFGQASKKSKGKGQARADEDEVVVDEEGSQRWPPRSWTSWPLPPDQVPREEETRDTDLEGEIGSRPSATLEDCLIATTTRFAREQWNARTWQPDVPLKRDMKVDHNEEGMSMTDSKDISEHESITPESDAADTFDTEPESDGGSPGFLSQVWPLPGETKSNVKLGDDCFGDEEPILRPVPIADNDLVRSVVLPSTRHVLSNLDELLLGLHKTRQAYAVPKLREDSDESEKSTIDAEASQNQSRQRWQRHSRSRSRKRKSSSASRPGTSSSTPANSRRDLNPRDWSDIIGMAHLTGWDTVIVNRAAARCANLSGQNMMFRTFFSGNATTNTKSSYDEYHAVTPQSSLSESVTDEEPDKADDTRPGRLRTSKACTYCHVRQQACVPSGKNSQTCQRCLNSDVSCSGITTTRLLFYGQKTCPVTDCDRHHRPFTKTSHLQRHIDTVHEPPRSQPITRFPSSPLPPSSSDPDLGSASSHRILCPVSSCSRHARPFTRSHRLYEHIRTQHPEIDVQAVKKLEGKKRGTSRGRYRDEGRRKEVGRRNRSRRGRASGERTIEDERERDREAESEV